MIKTYIGRTRMKALTSIALLVSLFSVMPNANAGTAKESLEQATTSNACFIVRGRLVCF